MAKKITVLGGGPGGYAAALYCSHLGMQVTLVEKQDLGGTCLNRGCIPTKVFVQASNVFAQTSAAGFYGIRVPDGIEVDFKKTSRLKNRLVNRMRRGVGFLLEKAEVSMIQGEGRLIDPRTIEVTGGNEHIQITSDAIIIATGSHEIEIPGLETDGISILNSTQMLDIQALPERTAIVGGGVIGVEFASILARFGKQVTIVEMSPSLIPTEDAQIAQSLRESLEKQGISILTQAKATGTARQEDGSIILHVKKGDGDGEDVAADIILVCVGRAANLAGLGLDEVGVRYNRKFIDTVSHMETSVPGIYAVGDITKSPQLAHVAYHEAKVAALHLAGQNCKADYHAVPGCIFSNPEVARVGMTEQMAREAFPDVKIELESFVGNGKAMIEHENEGFVKMIFTTGTHRLLGCSIIGPKATELIAEPTLAVHMNLSADILSATINAHPSLSEVVGETAAAAIGLNLHS